MRRWKSVAAAAGVIGVVVPVPAGAEPLAGGRACADPSLAVHTVAAGDSWYAIARSVKVSLRGLLEANDLDDAETIRPGDVVCLPSFATLPTPPSEMSTSTATAAPATTALAECAADYTVVTDDSWFAIARRNKITMTELLSLNEADVSRTLHPGDGLCLPASATAATTSAATSAASSPSTTTTTTTTTTTVPAAPDCEGSTYTVVLDDNWFLIARKAEVAMSALMSTNGADAATIIHPGEVLCLPEEAAPVESSASAGPLAALPVQGKCWYTDTWHAPRGGGRRHEGVDLITSRGAYVYAVADGKLSARAWDQPGLRAGNAWWLRADDGTTYFYAHLSDFAPDLKVGSRVEAGQIIGFIGDTGNAGGPHLHFEIHPNGGAAINPYPTVKAAGGCNEGTPYTQPGGWVPT